MKQKCIASVVSVVSIIFLCGLPNLHAARAARVSAMSADTAPAISTVTSAATSTTAIITWLTDEYSTSQVEYGTTASYSSTTTKDLIPVTSHSVILTDLTPSTLYHYAVLSVDAYGNAGVSPDNVFNTAAAPVEPVTPTTPVAPTGPSIRLVNSAGTYYVIQGGARHGVTNPAMLATYGLTLSQAIPSIAADDSLLEGSILTPGNGALVKSDKDQTVYLISNNQRRGFSSSAVFLALGFSFSSVLVVTDPELQAVQLGSIISDSNAAHPDEVDINYNGVIYWISGQTRYPYPDLATFNSWHIANDFSTVVQSNQADNSLPVGSPIPARTVN